MDFWMKLAQGIWLVGSSQLTNPGDCMIYLVDCGPSLTLIDSGSSPDLSKLEAKVNQLGFDPAEISHLILTHYHADHILGAPSFRSKYGSRLIMHAADAQILESGDSFRSLSFMFGSKLNPCPVDLKLQGDCWIELGSLSFRCIHIPGHTPGSIAVLVDTPKGGVLFGQDLHGPFLPGFGDLEEWERSMLKLLDLDFQILAEGHFGIFSPRAKALEYMLQLAQRYGRRSLLNQIQQKLK